MSITAKTGAVLLIVFAALLGGAWAILEQSVRPSFEQQEAGAHELDRTRVEANLHAISAELRGRAMDYAQWDDTYRFLSGAYPGYIRDNFADADWLTDYGADLAIFFNARGEAVWSRQWTPGGLTSADTELTEAVLTQIHSAHIGQWTEGAVWSSAGPLAFAAARATRTDGSGVSPGYVVIGRRLNTGALSKQTQLDLTFAPARPGAAAPSARTWRTSSHLNSLIPLSTADGRLIGDVTARSDRTISALGSETVGAAMALLAIVFAASFCVLWIVLRHVVIARVQRMERHFRAQSETVQPMEADDSDDEIGHLAQAYNEFVRRLAEADARARTAMLERESAAAANRMKSDFLANISYEMRTPLNDVIGYADLIEEELSDRGDTSVQGDLQRITGAARNMLSLITELLDLSRIEADRLEIVAEAFEVEEIFLSAAAGARSSARAHEAELNVIPPADLGQALTDQNRLRQCLVNVLTHASRRSSGRSLSLQAERRSTDAGEMLHFLVTDSGPPLNDAQIDGLFEPFLREDDERLSGARLGLAVTRKLAALMGGCFDVQSSTHDGCTYALTIPADLDAHRRRLRGEHEAGPSAKHAAPALKSAA
ncbi:MAG: hypothetical protein H7124_13115 [Phycisphaerales bacterium]|nr:hypothetical protein [Hyphomonadaceae bacterium]